jgi:hypothetical protein
VRAIASPSPASVPLSLLAGRSGADLRVALDSLLAENAFLSATAMQAGAAARLNELIGVSSALDTNTLTLAEIVGTLKGEATASAFADAWRGQSADLVNYAQGQQASASADLEARRGVSASQLAAGTFSVTDASSALQRRTQAELTLIDSSDSARKMAALLESSDDLGRPLAAAIAAHFSDLSPQTTEGPEIDLRLRLVSGLQEHVLLTGAAVAAAADGRAPEAQAYSDAAGAAADRLGGTLAPSDAATGLTANVGSGVADRLRSQTVAMVSAASGGDRGQAAQDMDRLRGEIDGLLSGANPLLPPGLLAQQLRASDQPLLTAADAFVAHDYPTAFARLHESLHQAQKPAETVAEAIVDRHPARFLGVPPPMVPDTP